MRYFQTDKDGFFTGYESNADESPLEPGVFMLPAGGVTSAPPAVGPEQAARWNGAAWETVPDLRGVAYWLPGDRTRREMKERGQALPAGAMRQEPPKTAAELAAEDSAAALLELAAIDAASIRDIRAYIAAKPDAPQLLKDREAAAVAARSRVL